MRLCELYTSIQGEGPNVGKPTTFIRFGGCNLRCPGWGEGKLPDGTRVPGCDTVFAVYPEWRHTWEQTTPQEIFDRVPESPRHVCLTGGEPLIQPKDELSELAWLFLDQGWTIDLFTNGSRLLSPHLQWCLHKNVTVVMDFKLPGSGEKRSFNYDNLSLLTPKDALKFVVKNKDDLDYLADLAPVLRDHTRARFYIGAVWGFISEAELASFVQKFPIVMYLNVQLHKYIWDPEERMR